MTPQEPQPNSDPNQLLKAAYADHQAGNIESALQIYRKLILDIPHEHQLIYLMGTAEVQLGNMHAGIRLLDQYLKFNATNAAAWNNKGGAFQALENYDDALKSYDQAILHNPIFAEAHNNRGIVLQNLHQFEEAEKSYIKAIQLNPHFAEAHFNLGVLYRKLLLIKRATDHLDEAIKKKPDYADALWAKSLLQLLNGQYEEGWKLYEWGWINKERGNKRFFLEPSWTGTESLFGKTIFIYSEQGLGDAIQFFRYTKLLSALGANVILEVEAPLQSIAQSLEGVNKIITRGSPLPHFDYQCSMLSLPLAFSTSLDNIPSHTPYLTVDPQKAGAWKSKLGNKTKARIGLSWFGNSAQKDDAQRSLDLHLLTPLLDLPFEFHSLHKEYRPQDTEILCKTPQIIDHHLDLQDFSDTAALMNEMDLVISVCTANAHLAGALGKQSWVLIGYESNYRWMLGRNDSPWYPSIRLIRQAFLGDWGSPINEIKKNLLAKAFLTLR